MSKWELTILSGEGQTLELILNEMPDLNKLTSDAIWQITFNDGSYLINMKNVLSIRTKKVEETK